MKKVLFLIVSLSFFGTTAFAQDDEQVATIMSYVQTIYNDAQASVKKAQDKKPENRPESMIINVEKHMPGIGVQNKKIEIFYKGDWTENGDRMYYSSKVYFSRVSYNVASNPYNMEYLFNEDEKLIYYCGKWVDEDKVTNEVKCYLKDDTSVEMLQATDEYGKSNIDTKVYNISDGNSWQTMDAVRTGEELIEAFSMMMIMGDRD